MNPHEHIFVAIDTPDRNKAIELARQLSGHVGGFKIGLEAFISHGPELVTEILSQDAELFVDLKLHDIPNTVAGAAAAVGRLGAQFFTVHALGGKAMIAAAVEASATAAEAAGFPAPTVLAVSVLTSHDDTTLDEIGLAGPCRDAVLRLAGLVRDAGAGGLVCSPHEVAAVRERFPEGTLVVPGIRPGSLSVQQDDQSRVATPSSAIADGADRLVIGRPITQAADPARAADAIAAEIAASHG
jgi:orotidine-5'-phosphate decarboxylase